MKKDSVCIIGVYFGRLRPDFPLWINSCKYNPSIDFLVVTDSAIPDIEIPENVTIKYCTFDELRILAKKKLGEDIVIGNPYKLCDYKPVYGLIFYEYLKDYEYWGHCDFDLVFGDIRYFLSKYEYQKYDHFLTQGHLSLYRNTLSVLNYYKLKGSRVGNYTTVFTSNKNFAFDENSGIGSIYLFNKLSMFKKNIYADISPFYKQLKRSKFNKIDKPPKNYKNQVFFWEKGKTYCSYLKSGNICTYQLIYIHFQKRKFPPLDLDKMDKCWASFYITPFGFVPKINTLNIELIKSLNPYSLKNELMVEIKWRFLWMLKRIKKYIFRKNELK